MPAKDTVVAAVTKLFIEQDPTAVAEYFGPIYKQHSTIASDGIEGLSHLAQNPPAEFDYQIVRVISEGDLVVVHGVYSGVEPEPLVAFDVYRVEGDRVVEHWDSLTPQVGSSVSGRTQIDGPTEPVDMDKTAANKAHVVEFAEKVLLGADVGVLTDYISTDEYAQHNPEAADGIAGFSAAVAGWVKQGKNPRYTKVHQVVAEGDFVFTRAEGYFGGPVAYNDLWRVENGKIVEHWDVIDAIPAQLAHDNGVF